MPNEAGVSRLKPGAKDRIEELEQLLGVPACRALGIFPVPDDWLLSVVIPVYNEVDTVAEVIERVRSIPVKMEIILVDDGSTDGTAQVLERYRDQPYLKICCNAVNHGKVAAL